MVSMPSIQSFIKEINDYRTTRQNINITYATLERRLKLDPWLPLVTTVSPSTVSNFALLYQLSPTFVPTDSSWQSAVTL